MFDEVALHYDRTNSVLSVGNSRRWRLATVRAVAPKPGERILDLAAGTGTSSVALAKSGAEVVAVDFSQGMIDVGRKRHPSITFVLADATQLPFRDGEFDAVTISFGLRNIEDPKKALAEMYRVTKPGGRLVGVRVLEAATSAVPRRVLGVPEVRHARRGDSVELESRGVQLSAGLHPGVAGSDDPVAVDSRCRVHPCRLPQPHRGNRRAAPRAQAGAEDPNAHRFDRGAHLPGVQTHRGERTAARRA